MIPPRNIEITVKVRARTTIEALNVLEGLKDVILAQMRLRGTEEFITYQYGCECLDPVDVVGILTAEQCVDAYNGGLNACKEWLGT